MPFELIQLPAASENADDLNSTSPLLVFNIADEKEGTIGRHSTCDFRIKSEDLPCFVSRKHALISVKDGCLMVQDLSSANGTYVNSTMLKPYTETPVEAGDCIAFGCRTEKVTPGLKANEKDMPFRFKIHETKVSAVRPTVFTKAKRKDEFKKNNSWNTSTSRVGSAGNTNGQAKRSDEQDSGFDDQELHFPKKRHISNDSEVSLKVTPKQPKAKKAKPKPVEEESEEEDSESEPESPLRSSSKKKGGTKKKKVSKYKSYAEDSEDNNDENEEDQNDDCQSYECLFRKKKAKKPKVVSWVQCDSCDRWFHTVCVGCDYNKVKLSSHQFHCGLC